MWYPNTFSLENEIFLNNIILPSVFGTLNIFSTYWNHSTIRYCRCLTSWPVCGSLSAACEWQSQLLLMSPLVNLSERVLTSDRMSETTEVNRHYWQINRWHTWPTHTVDTHRSVEHHDLPQHLRHIRQRIWRQTKATRVHQLSDELLAMLLHGLTNQLLPHLEVLFVLQGQMWSYRSKV